MRPGRRSTLLITSRLSWDESARLPKRLRTLTYIFSSQSDHDLERLYEQWEEDEEPLEPDELPEWDPRRPQPTIDFSKLDMSDTDNVMRATKKGKTVMMFVKVSGNPTPKETEDISSIWQTGLWNTHISADRFSLEDDRVIFVFKVPNCSIQFG